MYSKRRNLIGLAALLWAGYATAAVLPSTNDLWDISQGAVVTATSGAHAPVSDIRDMFGGMFSQVEPGDTIFADGQPAGFVHYVEWQTPTPVTIASFNLFAAGDGPRTGNQREFAQFVLKAKSSSLATNFDLTLYTLVVTNHPYPGEPLLSTNITPVTAQYFRAEFLQYTTGSGFDGPRVVELDGFGPVSPVVVSGPVSETVTAGQNASFSVSASGTPSLIYQWYENSTNIPAADNPTATNATLVLTDAQTNLSGNTYFVVVSNAFGTTNSSSVTLTVNPAAIPPPLEITQEPQSQTVPSGRSATFSVTATGPGPIDYEWQFDGTNLTPTGVITTVAGGGAGGNGGPATNANLLSPRNASLDAAGNMFIADQEHNTIRKVDANGTITTVVGNGGGSFSGDGGQAINATLQFPFGVVVDASGDLFVTDFYNHRIRKVATNGIITTVAGSGPTGPGPGAYSGDGGAATSARLNEPECAAVDAAGNLFIADYLNNRIRKVDTNGIITTLAGNGTAAFSGDGGPATNASLSGPNGVGVDNFGNVFIADSGNARVREVNPAGIITTVAGGGAGGQGDGGPATNIVLLAPTGVAADAFGDLFIVDTQDSRVREVDSFGTITTVAGTGNQGFSGDGGAPANASLNFPYQVTVDSFGNLFIADQANNRVRKVTLSDSPTLTINNVVSNNAGNYTVIVSNPYQSVTSSVAVLTVTPPVCTPVPAGIISWWPGEFSGMDIAGTNNATLVGGVTFQPGEVGEAFNLNGTSQYVDVPDAPSLNPTNAITCEAWINPAQFVNSPPIIKKDNPVAGGYTLELAASGGVIFSVYVNGAWMTTPVIAVTLNQWTHVAGVYNGLNASVYVNGVLAATTSSAGGTMVPAAGHLQIGHDQSNPTRFFKGLIDEPSIYNRALSAFEIQDIYDAGSAGKCAEPEIAMQPVSQVDYAGGSATLGVSVFGMGPFTYQWNYNGAPIANATNATLVLGDLQSANTGAYTVTVSNQYGSVTSAAANVTVNPPGISLALYPGVTISGAPGQTYGVQYSTNLNDTNDWLGLANVTLIQTNELYFDLQPASLPHRYYRVLPGPITIP